MDFASELRKYPDPAASKLVAALSKAYNMPEDQIFVGVGSDDKNSKNNKDEDTKSDSGEENASPKPSPGEKKVVIKRD